MYSRTDARTLTSETVSQLVSPVFEHWGIKRAWLYGSVALGIECSIDKQACVLLADIRSVSILA